MKDWKHLTFEQRKVISNGICQKRKLKEIAEVLGYDPTSISKEVKRNRENITIGLNSTDCKKLTRWPYVCSGWSKIYNNQCCFTKYKYDAEKKHEFIRYVLPKGSSLKNINQEDCNLIMNNINSLCRDSLNGKSPHEAMLFLCDFHIIFL